MPTEVPIGVARAAWLRLMIPPLQACGFTELAARYGVELQRLEALSTANYCQVCEFDHTGPCEYDGRPAIQRGEID